jgi:DNA-binding beta-propeller fold protein YncE
MNYRKIDCLFHRFIEFIQFFQKNIFILIISLFFISVAGCATLSSTESVSETQKGEYIWPKPPAPSRIKWLSQWSNRNDFGKQSKVLEFLVGKERVESLHRPSGIVSDSAGNIFVADPEMHMVFLFDMERRTLNFLGMGTFKSPVGLAIDNKQGVLYVSDSGINKVFGVNKRTGDVVITIGSSSEFKQPSGMVFDEEKGRLYISDTQNHMIKVYDRQGRQIFTIGKRGADDGELNFPSYLALDKSGRLYVVDSFNFRIQVFDSEGKFLNKFGQLGTTTGSFSRPTGIGLDSEGHIYVVDSAFNNFQIFDTNGKLLLWIGNAGTKPGEFYMPLGMYIDNTDKIYIADTFNRRVQVFQYLKEQK